MARTFQINFPDLTPLETIDLAISEPLGSDSDLEQRRPILGNQLSGGEQQMLAVPRAPVLDPPVMWLDEPPEGLAPIIVEELLVSRRIIRDEGMSAMLVEQNAKKILGVTDHAVTANAARWFTPRTAQCFSATAPRWRYISASPTARRAVSFAYRPDDQPFAGRVVDH